MIMTRLTSCLTLFLKSDKIYNFWKLIKRKGWWWWKWCWRDWPHASVRSWASPSLSPVLSDVSQGGDGGGQFACKMISWWSWWSWLCRWSSPWCWCQFPLGLNVTTNIVRVVYCWKGGEKHRLFMFPLSKRSIKRTRVNYHRVVYWGKGLGWKRSILSLSRPVQSPRKKVDKRFQLGDVYLKEPL